MNIYLVAAFSYKDDEKRRKAKSIIDEVTKALRDLGHNVFTPHEHKFKHSHDFTNKQWGQMVFGVNLDALEHADVVVAISYGKENNQDGFAWECGYAYAREKEVILLSPYPDKDESLMVAASAYCWLGKVIDLLEYDFEKMPQLDTSKNLIS